uniref:CCHC-type domain-containing protein n=1 Tax=Davidia involucrata TaxID=16924 RepID=A0A5B7B3A2_DAVIN
MKKKHKGSAMAKRKQLQTLRSEFEMLRMKSGESVADYFSRTMGIVNKMRIHGDKTKDVTIIEKILRSMTPKFNFVVCSIEESKDIDELSIEELQGSLQVHEQKINQQEKEEQALKASIDNHFSTPNRGRGRGGVNQDRKNLHQTSEDNQFHDFQRRGRGRGGHHSTANRPKSRDKYNVECFRCHRYGHYRSECRMNLNKNRGEKSNFAEKEEEVSLLMVCHTKEETHNNLWYLDTGCSNHMCGEKSAFSDLDESFCDSVKFGDNSRVSVMGKWKVSIQTKGNFVQTISNVLFVPDLRTNLLSVGQLQEKGYEISIKDEVCRIEDEKLGLIAQVNMTASRMFPMYLHNITHSCFSARLKEEAWLWHFHYGHLNFGGLKTLQ